MPTTSLGHGSLLGGLPQLSHLGGGDLGGIGPHGAGFYRYAPATSNLGPHTSLPLQDAVALKPVGVPAVLKTLPQKHYEHYVSSIGKL